MSEILFIVILIIIIVVIILIYIYRNKISTIITDRVYDHFINNDDEQSLQTMKDIVDSYANHVSPEKNKTDNHNIRMITKIYERYGIRANTGNNDINKYIENEYRIIDDFNNYLIDDDRIIDDLIVPDGLPEIHHPVYVRDQIHANRQNLINDSQNVHDTGYTLTFNDNISKLINLIGRPIRDQNTDKLMHIEIEKWTDANPKAKMAFNKMYGTNALISGINSDPNFSERDLLDLIYRRINSPENKKNKDDMVDSFVNQLEDSAISSDAVYCIAGRTRRILSSLAKVDNDENLGVMYSSADINELMGSKLSNMFENMDPDKDPQIALSEMKKEINDEYKTYMHIPDVAKYHKDAFAAIEEIINE